MPGDYTIIGPDISLFTRKLEAAFAQRGRAPFGQPSND